MGNLSSFYIKSKKNVALGAIKVEPIKKIRPIFYLD